MMEPEPVVEPPHTSDNGAIPKSKRTISAQDQATGQFTDPVYKKISVRNGEINKMTKEELKQKLSQHHMDTRGVKEVLKKRLKNYYKKRQLMKAKVRTSKGPDVFYDYILVIDFEATCQENNPPGFTFEIIEFPIVLINTMDLKVESEFQSYCRPQVHPHLTPFCTSLTGITQATVNKSDYFPKVFARVEEWMQQHKLLEKGCKIAIATDGPWDMSRFLYHQCRLSKIPFPPWAAKWINVRKAYSNFYGTKRAKLSVMLENLGMEFEGQQHSGIDDARNIARIVIHLLRDGCELRINEELFKRKMKNSTCAEEAIVMPISKKEAEGMVSDDDDVAKQLADNEDKENSVIEKLSDLHLSDKGKSNIQNRHDIDSEDDVEDLLVYYRLQQK